MMINVSSLVLATVSYTIQYLRMIFAVRVVGDSISMVVTVVHVSKRFSQVLFVHLEELLHARIIRSSLNIYDQNRANGTEV